MQVACPNCGARYLVDPAAIGPTGRTVQCSRCSHRWFETIDPPSAPPKEFTPQERPAPDFVIRPQIYGGGLPAIASPRGFPRWPKVVIGIAVLLVLFGGMAFAFKDELLPLLPPEARQALGLELPAASVPSASGPAAAAAVAPPQSSRAASPSPSLASTPPATPPAEPATIGLEVDLAASKIDLVDGHYVVRGEIVNKGKMEASIHALKLLFKMEAVVLGERFYPLFAGPIQPGARQAFSQILDDPPAGTTDIVPTVE